MATINQTLKFSTRAAIKVPSFLKAGGAGAIPQITKKPVFETVKGPLAPPSVPVQVRNRYGLPGALDPITNPRLPEFLSNPLDGFPAVLEAKDANKQQGSGAVVVDGAEDGDDPALWARALKPYLDEMLPKHGAVLVRGLGPMVQTPQAMK
jgi:hypothetical protein